MELDAAGARSGLTHAADLCIVGAGPAGLAVAHELRASGLEIVVIESGGPSPASGSRELNAGECIGDRFGDLRDTRARGIGGTATIWNTHRGDTLGAKYAPLSPSSFERRDWMPWSGWPFDRRTLDPWYVRAQELCALGPFIDDATLRERSGHPRLLPTSVTLAEGIWWWGSAAQFTEVLPERLREASRVLLIRGATVTGIGLMPGGDRVREVRWSTLDGRRGTVLAERVVLAAGTVENTRLLFHTLPDRTREDDGWLGRGFMEHPTDRCLTLQAGHAALSPTAGPYDSSECAAESDVMRRLVVADAALRQHRLPNASLRILGRRLALPGRAARKFLRLSGRQPPTPYWIFIDLEQAPHRDNRIVLSDQRDALGMHRVRVHWRWREADEAQRLRVRLLVASELERLGVGTVGFDHRLPLKTDAHHHAGTTRMSEDPAEGVVDANARVHGIGNLYVAGASTFPAAGVENPTLTVVALALRLADHLRA